MNIVLIHLGSPPPDHMYIAAMQARRYASCPIYFVANNVDHTKLDETITTIPFDIATDARCLEFDSAASFINKHGLFWSFAFKRLFVLEIILQKYCLTDAIHIENDVMIYSDPGEMDFSCFNGKCAGQRIALNDNQATYAYMYVPGYKAIKALNDANLRLLSLGEAELHRQNKGAMLNEMGIAYDLMDSGELEEFPTLPNHRNAKCFDGLFDGASWGQYALGIPGQLDVHWAEDRHFVGKEIRSGNADLFWVTDSLGYKVPIAQVAGKAYKLLNLHVHSKQLHLAR